MLPFGQVLFLLLVAHAVTDFALQGPQFAAKVPSSPIWPYVLTAHALVNAAGVFVVTGSFGLALAEMVWHWLNDAMKTRGYLSLHGDQTLHLLSKALWAAIATA